MDKIKARELRKNLTKAERTLWKHLRIRQLGGYKFRRQQPIEQYIVDFVCLEKRLIIELDGGQHSEQVSSDSRRSAWLETQGYQVLRFWNNQVLEETEAVIGVIMEALGCQFDSTHLNPPPQVGRNCRKRPAKEGCVKIFNQKGFSLIIAIVMLIIFGMLAAMLTSLVTTDSDIAMYQARSGEALYIANAGQQYLMKQAELIYPNFYVSTKSLPPGSFTISPSARVFPTAMTVTSPANGENITVTDTTEFPSSGRILIDSELIDYTAKSAGSFDNVTRARGGTLASAHAINAGVYLATALSASVTNSATTIPVSSTTGFIIPGTVKVDQEFIYCTSIIGTTSFTGCTRGAQGSQSMAHNAGASAVQITTTVTGIVPTGIIGDAKRVLRAQAGKYLDGWSVGGAVPIASDLNSVFCVTTTNCWAVGAGGTIIHYDGISWATVSSPTTQDLNEVHCVSATDCWAVGNAGTIIRWLGISWNAVGVNTIRDLFSIFMLDTNGDGLADDGWAVGQREVGVGRACANNTPNILRFEGGAWVCRNTNDTDDRMDLFSVHATSTNVWIVGEPTNRNNATCFNDEPTIFHATPPSQGNPVPWTCANDPLNNNDQMNLNSVFAIPGTAVWTVGDFQNSPGQTCIPNTPTIFRNTIAPPSEAWSCVNTGDNDDRMNLNSVFALPSTDIWVVGDTTNRNNATCMPNGAPTIFKWNGVGWSCANTGAPAENYNGIYCVTSSDCWAVGTNGTTIHWNGTAWSAPPSPPPALLRWNGINWDNVSTPVGLAQSLNSISMLDIDLNGFSEDGWAVGDRRGCANPGLTILRWDGASWACPGGLPVIDQNLNSVYMLSATDGWTVGNRIANATNGWTFLRWNSPTAGTWNQITVTTAANAQNLNSVSMVSGSDGWAVGNRIGAGNNQWTFLRWTGSWSQFTVTTVIGAQNLNSIFMVSATDGWAVGNRRGCANPGLTILRWDGASSSWACPAGLPVVDQNLNSVYMLDTNSDGIADDGWAVGNRRGCANPGLTILRWDGASSSWACPAGLPVVDQNLNSVYCNSSSDCWAKGNTGTILHWDGTNWSQYPSPTANALNEVFMTRPQNFLRLADWQEVY